MKKAGSMATTKTTTATATPAKAKAKGPTKSGPKSHRGRPGDGSVFTDRSGRMWAVYDHGSKEGGGRNRKKKRVYTKGDGQLWLKEQSAMNVRGEVQVTSDSTWGEVIEDYLRAAEGTYGTERQREWLLRKHATTFIREDKDKTKGSCKALKVRDLTSEHVLKILQAAGGKPAKDREPPVTGPLGTRSTGHLRDKIRACLNWAIKEKIVQTNAAVGVELPYKIEERKPHILVEAQCTELLAAAAKLAPDYELWFNLQLSVALRFGELAGMSWNQWEAKTATLKVNQQAQPVRKGTGWTPDEKDLSIKRASFMLPEPKWFSDRVIVLPERLVELFEKHRQRQLLRLPDMKRLAGTRWKGDDLRLVFPSSFGTPVGESNWTKMVWNKVLASTSIPYRARHDCQNRRTGRTDHNKCEYLTPHSLRHTGLSLLQDQLTAAATMDISGHRTPAVLARYTHTTDQQKRLTLGAIGRIASLGQTAATAGSQP